MDVDTGSCQKAGMDTEHEGLSLQELGGLLVRCRAAIDSAEAEWLGLLAEFDHRCGWALDGHATCVSWLMHHCGMARSTAKDRLRVALELQRRPLLAEGLASGKVSYAKVKALTRITDADDETDAVLLGAAEAGRAGDMDVLVRHHRWHAEQERPPVPVDDRIGVRTLVRRDGVAT